MFNKEVIVRCESGLHNRQATYFVQKANEFYSSIWVESGNRKMNAKSLLGYTCDNEIPGTSDYLERYLLLDYSEPVNAFSYAVAWTCDYTFTTSHADISVDTSKEVGHLDSIVLTSANTLTATDT